jgi:predicted ester cyclase
MTTSIARVAREFFEACEAGKGWEVCKDYCQPNATFSAQAEPLADVRSLQQYTEWMKGLMTIIPDGRYEIKSFATDDERKNVCAYGVFSGTHTGQGGPCPPTGKSVASDYVYVMEFDGARIKHMTKIWNAGVAMKELGWV